MSRASRIHVCGCSVACDNAGRILNPLLAEGQRHGGLAQGAAQALYEHVAFERVWRAIQTAATG